MNIFDAKLRADAPFRRYASLSAAGIDLSTVNVSDREKINQLIKDYREKFTRLMIGKFRTASLQRAASGSFVNLDEALDGESDCFRRRLPHKSPLRVGINMSRTYGSDNVVAIRGAAILALIDLCKSRGQQVVCEIAYGNGKTLARNYHCHVRINLAMPSIETLTRVTCSDDLMKRIGKQCVAPLAPSRKWQGIYRFAEFSWQEYDFVLDRIETSDAATEERRVLAQLEKFKLT